MKKWLDLHFDGQNPLFPKDYFCFNLQALQPEWHPLIVKDGLFAVLLIENADIQM